jgi:Rhodopirellula transposase DDE domain
VDERLYPAGEKVSDEELAKVNIARDEFHGEWNYRISPRQCQLKL